MYNQTIENETNPILNELESCKNIDEIENILNYDENAEKLKIFCISMVVRNKRYVHIVSDTKRDVGQYDERFCEHDMNIVGMVELLNNFIRKPFNLRILHIANSIPYEFITSDFPFVGLCDNRILKSPFAIPLLPKILAVVIPKRDEELFDFTVDEINDIAFIKYINTSISEGPYDWLISNNQNLLKTYVFK